MQQREDSITIRRVNDLPETPAPTECGGGTHVRWDKSASWCQCGAYRYTRVRYSPHQGAGESLRRLKQIARRQLSGAHVSPEARATVERARLAYHATMAEQACHAYVNDAIKLGEEDRLPGRDRLYVAVGDLARWLRGEPDYATATASTTLDAPPADGHRGNDLAA
jgi:hypothetical protein